MLLRVTKVTGGNSASDPRPSSDPPLHACLATADVRQAASSSSGDRGDDDAAAATQGGSQLIGGVPHAVIPASPLSPVAEHRISGEVLTVGRKNCTATLDDKCVSRTHATIALLSNRHPRPPVDASPGGGGAPSSSLLLDDGRVMMEYGTPSTPEEMRACESSTTGVICVIRDMGSKFGTYVSVDEAILAAEHSSRGVDGNDGGAGEDDETGDETDDEGGGAAAGRRVDYVELTEKQVRAVRLLSDDRDSNDDVSTTVMTLPRFQKLGENQSRPLLQLSHSAMSSSSSSSSTTSFSAGPRHVVVLFGPQGSAIRLSLVPLTFTFSRIKPPDLDPILASLHYVGASHSVQWDVGKSTHLVAPEKTAAAKGIMAWACRRPVVTTGYVEAMLRRRDAREGLPREEDYCPKGTWDANLRYTPEPSTALRGYLVAVMVDDDNAPLARSAGAEVLPLHEEAPTSPSQAAFESWWEACVLRARADGLAVAVVASSSKRCKHLHDWLKRDGTVRFTNAKNLAKAITFNNGEGDLLLDVDKGVIEKVGRAAGPGGIKEVGPPSAPAMAAAPSAKAPEDAVETSKKPDANEAYFPPNDDDDNDEMPVSTGRKRPQEEESGNNAEQSGGDQQPPDHQKRRRKNRDEGASAEEVDRAEEEVSVAEPVASETSSAAANNQERKVVDESSDDEPGLPAERMPLPTTEDGWLVAAPKRRKAFRKDRDEDFVADEDVPGSAAETERISGLIVRDYVPPNGVSRGGGATVGRANRKKKDFKRFRKNNVLLGYTTFNANGGTSQHHSNIPKIHLVDVLPKESARQLLLQQQQENFEREQELADHLFNDVGGAQGGRKHGGGTMLSYLSQSTTKRERGRR